MKEFDKCFERLVLNERRFCGWSCVMWGARAIVGYERGIIEIEWIETRWTCLL